MVKGKEGQQIQAKETGSWEYLQTQVHMKIPQGNSLLKSRKMPHLEKNLLHAKLKNRVQFPRPRRKEL